LVETHYLALCKVHECRHKMEYFVPKQRLCRRGEIKDQEIKRSRDQELYQGVVNRKIYSYFGEALKGGRWYSSVKYMRETLEQIYIHLNKSNLISCYARSILNIKTNYVPLIRLQYCHFPHQPRLTPVPPQCPPGASPQ
jgi:hypothetical protein